MSEAATAILVLGMHRSGTSAVSRAVGLLGAQQPSTLMPPAPDNPRGFWESAVIAALNDRVLAAGGSHWADWRRFDAEALAPGLRAGLEREMRAALEAEFGAAPLLVLKDPRMSRLLPVWAPVWVARAISPCAIVALRHPGAVARSLGRRNAMPASVAALLWLRHVLDAERDTRGMRRAFVSYDALLRDWRGALARAGLRLGVAWPRDPGSVADGFLDRRAPDAEAGPEAGSAYAEVWCRHAWQALRALEAGEDATATLDRVREQFEDACRLFGAGLGMAAAPARSPGLAPTLAPATGLAFVLASTPACAPGEVMRPAPGPAVATQPWPAPPLQAGGTLPAPALGQRPGRLALHQVTLCAADSHRVKLTVRALEACVAQCDFADALLLSDQHPETALAVRPIPRLESRDAYSRLMLAGLVEHVGTSHVLVVQWDGFVVAPAAWDAQLLACDYVGARWAWHPAGTDVGNGGFSLRSRRLLEALQHPRFAPQPGVPEDELICRAWRPVLEREHAIRFAPPPLADRFAYERSLPRAPTFGFHGLWNLGRHLDDAALAGLAPLLPEDVRRGREFAELLGLCFLQGRPAVVQALAAGWSTLLPPQHRRAALAPVLRRPELVDACLRLAGG